jgi:WD40 repeat protein
MDSYVYVYDSKSAKQKKKFRIIEGGPVFCLHYVQATNCVWAGTDLPGKSIVMVTAKGKPTGTELVGHTKKVNAIIECNGHIWSCSTDRTIMIWSLEGECIRLLQGHAGPIFSIVDTGSHVWSASWDKRVILWDSEYQSFYKEFEPHDDAVSSVIYIRENHNIWTGSWDRSIRLWSKSP